MAEAIWALSLFSGIWVRGTFMVSYAGLATGLPALDGMTVLF